MITDMKKYTKILLSLLLIGITFQSCEDETLITLPVWETAVHGYAVINGTSTDFKKGDATIDIDFDLKWKSIDKKNEVTKIDLYVLFNETYTDKDGNSVTAKHGETAGKLVKSFSGSEVPVNNAIKSFSINQNEVFTAYSSNTYDYGFGAGAVNVFSNVLKPTRNATTNKFIPGDSFTVKWIFTTADGRVFDSWSPSVCTEFPEANCQVDWTVICAKEIEQRTGDWTIYMEDTYGDGWQGGKIEVVIDGVVVEKIGLLDGNSNPAALSKDTKIVTIPAGTKSLYFNWTDDSYNSECYFTIKNPNGNTLAAISTPSAGPIKLDLCNE
jgi:hypothetical protein